MWSPTDTRVPRFSISVVYVLDLKILPHVMRRVESKSHKDKRRDLTYTYK